MPRYVFWLPLIYGVSKSQETSPFDASLETRLLWPSNFRSATHRVGVHRQGAGGEPTATPAHSQRANWKIVRTGSIAYPVQQTRLIGNMKT